MSDNIEFAIQAIRDKQSSCDAKALEEAYDLRDKFGSELDELRRRHAKLHTENERYRSNLGAVSICCVCMCCQAMAKEVLEENPHPPTERKRNG